MDSKIIILKIVTNIKINIWYLLVRWRGQKRELF